MDVGGWAVLVAAFASGVLTGVAFWWCVRWLTGPDDED